MPRLTKIDDVFFPVEERPVFVSFMEKDGERRVAVPAKKAIVNYDTRRVLGIVSRGYRLVSNAEALDMARTCCCTVFPETKPSEWVVKGVDSPSTAGYCYIDLDHNTTALDFSFFPPNQRPDAYGPFIRVTNSFNGLRALRFDIGFFRKVCKNGLIVPDTIISFKFTHLQRDIGETIQFLVKQDRLSALKTTFTNSLAGLRNCDVPLPQFEPLIYGVLQIKPPKSIEQGIPESEDWKQLGVHIKKMCTRYAGELGYNAYAAFNVITEFASHPPTNSCIHRERHSLQRLAGSWLASFYAASHKPGFSIHGYLEELAKERARTVRFTREPVTEN
jgi:hypothetical protein